MTDPTLPPEQEAVRRLLADARHDGPTPPGVVARLDATLDSLAAERDPAPTATPSSSNASSDSSSGYSAPVVDLAARRRRIAGMGLLAAAAVVVAGVALAPVLRSMQGSSDAGSSSGSDMATSQRELGAGPDSDAGGSADSQEVGPESMKSSAPSPFASYPTLSSDDSDLDDELLQLRTTYDASSLGSSTRLEGCDLRGIGPGRRVIAEVDGRVGAVVFRRADGATQQVDLYTCGDPTVVRRLTLPAP